MDPLSSFKGRSLIISHTHTHTQCGFFRRKTKPDGENETEGGDFDPPMEGTKGSYNPQQKEAAMATKPDEEVSKL